MSISFEGGWLVTVVNNAKNCCGIQRRKGDYGQKTGKIPIFCKGTTVIMRFFT